MQFVFVTADLVVGVKGVHDAVSRREAVWEHAQFGQDAHQPCAAGFVAAGQDFFAAEAFDEGMGGFVGIGAFQTACSFSAAPFSFAVWL